MVRRLLPMNECIEVMEPAMLAASAGTATIPPRQFSAIGDGPELFGMMPGTAPELGSYGAKVISLHPANPGAGLPAIQGFVALFDYHNGAPLALLEGAAITAIRTAAASGLATRELAPPDAASCGIFGTGVQAITHIDAMCAVRPVSEIRVWARDHGKAVDFAAGQAERTGLDVCAVADPAEAAACALLCTVTGASEPILQSNWVQPGSHINLVGAHTLNSREADSALIARSAVYVDLLESAHNEAGDVMIPIHEGLVGPAHIIGEIGQLLAGTISGRREAGQITIYKSLGITAQDLYAADYVYQRALAEDSGQVVQL
ncbi:MAG: ornithine cyclodeaminase family protein [Halieaceae bacterium]